MGGGGLGGFLSGPLLAFALCLCPTLGAALLAGLGAVVCGLLVGLPGGVLLGGEAAAFAAALWVASVGGVGWSVVVEGVSGPAICPSLPQVPPVASPAGQVSEVWAVGAACASYVGP